jgi:hypothetical protein
VALAVAAKFTATISQNPQKIEILFLKPGKHSVVEQIGRSDRVFAIVEFDQCYFAVRIDKGLLVNSSNTFDVSYIVSVLAAEISGCSVSISP